MSQTVDLCTYSQYNAEFSGRIQRSNDRTSCKVNKWFLQGADSNSQWLTRDFPFDKPILPITDNNKGNLVIGSANGGNSIVSYPTVRGQVTLTKSSLIDSYHYSSQGQHRFIQGQGRC